MNLEQASQAALAAAQAGDLDALAEALEARRLALERGESPTPTALTTGAIAGHLLRNLILTTRADKARLEHLWSFVTSPPKPASVDVSG